MKFAPIAAGTFWMGGSNGQPGDRQVEIARDFYLGIYPVTQGEWQAVMGGNPSHFSRSGEGAVSPLCANPGFSRVFPSS